MGTVIHPFRLKPHMLNAHQTLFSTFLLLLTLTACGKVDFKGQNIHITHDPEADTLELNLVYYGVMARGAHAKETKRSMGHRESEDLLKAVASIESMAKGAKRFMPIAPVFVIDLDERADELRAELEAEGGKESGEAKLQLAMIERITIEEVHVSLDNQGRIQMHQKIKFEGAKDFTASLNKALRDGLLLWAAEESGFRDESAHILDINTCDSWLEEAKEGKDWLRWDGTSLVASMPMSPGSTARLLQNVYHEIAIEIEGHNRVGMASMLALISEVSTEDGRLTLRLDPNDHNALTFSIPEDDRKYATSLVEALQEKGFLFHKADTKK